MQIMLLGRKSTAALAYMKLIDMGIKIPYVVCEKYANETSTNLHCLENVANNSSTQILYQQDLDQIYSDPKRFPNNIDLVVSVHHSQRIKEPLLSTPRLGAINFHPAPLPEYRGVRPYIFAIINNETSWGATCHYMDPHFDTGDIVKVKRFDITPKIETGFSLMMKTEDVMLNLIQEVFLELLENEQLPRNPQSGGSYYSSEDVAHHQNLDVMSMDSEQVDRYIRAYFYPPREGAYTVVNGKKLLLTTSRILQQQKKKQ